MLSDDTSSIFSNISDINNKQSSSLDDIGPHTVIDGEIAAKIKPFELEWVYGSDVFVPLVNLTKFRRKKICYVANHNIVHYDFDSEEMQFLRGHQHKIKSISYDANGKFIVSGDVGKNHSVIVWDAHTNEPIYTIFEPYPETDTMVVGISSTATYLVTIGTTPDYIDYIIDFWLWTKGDDKPNDRIKISSTYGFPRKVMFHPNENKHVMIVFDSVTVFFEWDPENQKIVNMVFPKVRQRSRYGSFTDGTYVEGMHECYVSTSGGYILKYGSNIYTKDFYREPLDNKKFYLCSLKISTGIITCVTSVDGVVAIGDSTGYLKFYDGKLKLLYWQGTYTMASICNISFNLNKRMLWLCQKPTQKTPINRTFSSVVTSNSGEELQVNRWLLPSEVTIEKETLVVRPSFVSTEDGNFYYIDPVLNAAEKAFNTADDYIGGIDTHDEKPLLVIAYKNGRLSLYNYEIERKMVRFQLPINTAEDGYDETTPPTLTCIKYSPFSLHLACGRSNGEVWILEPILLSNKCEPFQISRAKVEKIVFSANCQQMAYYDDQRTTFLFFYNNNLQEWSFFGKIRAHYKTINDILFYPSLPSKLFTCGCDRFLVLYNNNECYDDRETVFGIADRSRIEQTAIPMKMMWYPIYDEANKSGFILIADNEYKYKLLCDTTMMIRNTALGPAYGCFKNEHIKKMIIVPNTNAEYMVFVTNKHIGLQLLPPDGNPYRFIGTQAHPDKLTDVVLSYDGKYAFTYGNYDWIVSKFRINHNGVKLYQKIGGRELEPFYCLIEGGKNGWFFQEMEDLFYYMQILHVGEHTMAPRVISNKITVAELPDLVRACGYYPTEFEIENMLVDIRYRDFEANTTREEITFTQFVQLFINHRPPYGYHIEELENAFDTYCTSVVYGEWGCVENMGFVQGLTKNGENFSIENIHKCLKILLRVDEDDESNFSFLPSEIDFAIFSNDILGIDMNRTQLDEKPEEKEDKDDKSSLFFSI